MIAVDEDADSDSDVSGNVAELRADVISSDIVARSSLPNVKR